MIRQCGIDFYVEDGDRKETILSALRDAKWALRAHLERKGHTKIVRARRSRRRETIPMRTHFRLFRLDVWVDALR